MLNYKEWWADSPENLVTAVVGAIAFYVALIVASRISGLRAYSKMSAFDFPLTVAVGSLVAATILTPDPPLLRAAVILATILLMQAGVALARSRSEAVRTLTDNQPLLLARNGQLIHANLRSARISVSEVRAKLREANAHSLQDVQAVVLETTGDVSVLHGSRDAALDPWLMSDVRGFPDTVPTPGGGRGAL